ncbi:hypothetical protein SDC9_126429 [bioreactor metagenome]|uniref:Uncharacterized protein n=1 Tax=bioreactor metagenome TaxID=1076179 RepID=A0A645CQP6_9ZZZZ
MLAHQQREAALCHQIDQRRCHEQGHRQQGDQHNHRNSGQHHQQRRQIVGRIVPAHAAQPVPETVEPARIAQHLLDGGNSGIPIEIGTGPGDDGNQHQGQQRQQDHPGNQAIGGCAPERVKQ